LPSLEVLEIHVNVSSYSPSISNCR
jgi:hypothetical protein